MSKRKKIIMIIIAVLLIMIVGILIYFITYKNPADGKLKQVGIEEKSVQVGEVTFNYAEGPNNGPALVLLHAQLLDWYSYSKVLPELSAKFHVYALDYPGHGKTVVPENYVMSAENIGGDIGRFIDEVIGEKVFVTGNSSGGLLAVWLAANRPDIVKAVVLEDPPLFSSEYPTVKGTVAYKAFTQSNNALTDDSFDGDYLMYWINNSKQFFATYVFDGADKLINAMVRVYRTFRPGEPIELPFIPISVQEMIRGLDYYNPRFGQSFYEGTWNDNFDHAEALSQIECPVFLIQANFGYLEDGTLNGAMSQEMAEKAVSLIKNCEYKKLDCGHVTHLEAPDDFIEILESFFLGE